MANTDVTRIAGNIGALNSLYALQNVNNELATHQARLSTGKRLMQAADDPAGMLIATTFDIRRQGLQTALSGIGDAKNLMATMEGGLTKIQGILVKMRTKATEASADTIGENERSAIQVQLQAYRDEINDIVSQTQWNGNSLLGSLTSGSAQATQQYNFITDAAGGLSRFAFAGTGSAAGYTVTSLAAGGVTVTTSNIGNSTTGSAGAVMTMQSFASDTNQTVSGSFAGMTGVTGLGLSNTNLTVTGSGSAGSTTRANTFSAIDQAVNVVKQGIAQVGAFTARMTFKEEQISVQHANTEAAYNRIMNADMADEQVQASKLLILQQTATAMLAQANTAPQFLLQLFR
jgi:flagellin